MLVPPSSLTRLQRPQPLNADELMHSPGQSPISWELVIPAQRRERALEGALRGCAVAEAMSLATRARNCVVARKRVQQFRDPRCRVVRMPGARTHGMIQTLQSLLLSRASIDRFAKALGRRIRWYRVSRPWMSTRDIVMSFAMGKESRAFLAGFGRDPITRAAILSVILQGHSNGGLRWVQRSTVVTHRDRLVCNAAMFVAIAMQYAQVTEGVTDIPRHDFFALLADATSLPEWKERLHVLGNLLGQRRSLVAASKSLGVRSQLQDDCIESVLIGLYAWLRYRGDYRRTIERIAMLGGDTRAAAAIAGALAGAEHGPESIPEHWKQCTQMEPNDGRWMEECIERLRDWPHGPEDIQRTSSLRVMPLRQCLRNIRDLGLQITLPLRRWVDRLTNVKRDGR